MSRLRDRGFSLRDVRAVVFPATGPKWLATAGIDRVLARSTELGGGDRVLLAGASAGAWRALAVASKNPEVVHEHLRRAYCEQRFTRADSPEQISAAYRGLLTEVFERVELAHALSHPRFDLSITTARMLGIGVSPPSQRALAMRLMAAGVSNALTPRGLGAFFEAVRFQTSQLMAKSAGDGRTKHVLLELGNALDVALASGSVPFHMSTVSGIANAPQGAYLDGGIVDYHLNHELPIVDGLVLLISHQPRVIAGWFDKLLPWRNGGNFTANVVLVYPDLRFIRELPGGQIPTRDDFVTFLHAPDERARRWLAIAESSDRLGEQFLNDAAGGFIAASVEPL
jgi:hypothetical protein